MFPFSKSHLIRLAGIAVLATGLAACATDSGPAASAPPASQTSLGGNPAPSAMPATARTATPAGGGMAGMNHGNMQGMNHGNMAGMDHSAMGGMNMQQMMAHCQEMRATVARGGTLSPDMQQMMAHCNMMGGSQPASGRR